MLHEELSKLEVDQLTRVAELWGASKIPRDKSNLIKLLKKMMVDEYFLKGVLEKLTPVQVKIYSVLVSSKNVLTLGEISRKIQLQPINVEKELAVLKHLMLVYQRKNRERITSNLDKYYPFEEIRKLVSVDTNQKGEKFRITIKKEIEQAGFKELDPAYQKILGKNLRTKQAAEKAVKDETLKKILKGLNENEIRILDETFTNGGIMEISAARILLDDYKLPVEATIRKFHSLHILRDVYFIDDRFVRVLVMPVELFEYLCRNPLFPKVEGVKQLQAKTISNYFDVVLNLKKVLLFISNKGLTLAQSETIRQLDMKKSEDALLDMDLNLFPEKSQVHLIEILLPFLKMFDLVDLRGENVILRESYEEFLKRDPLELIKELVEETAHAAEKRMVGPEVFLPTDIPFFRRSTLDRCIQLITDHKEIYVKVLVAILIREWVILSPGFRVRNFKSLYLENRGAIVSALFYSHLFGLLEVDYPRRKIRLSELGRHYFYGEEIREENKKGAFIVNPDATVVAFPEKLSIYGLHLLKSFAELKEFDKIYTFQITKESVQQGIMLGNPVEKFTEFLETYSRTEVPQNLKFLISDWSEEIPIVRIEEGVVLLETSDPKLTELLVGSLKGKKIIRRELSPTALVIAGNRINEVMDTAEKLEMIVKLIR